MAKNTKGLRVILNQLSRLQLLHSKHIHALRSCGVVFIFTYHKMLKFMEFISVRLGLSTPVPPTLKLQVLSDLHLEQRMGLSQYRKFDIPAEAEYLVLAGNIGRLAHPDHVDAYRSFLRKQCENFKRVFLIAGNGEFSDSETGDSFEGCLRTLRDFAKHPAMRHRLTVLEEDRFDFDHLGYRVTLLGCTLWARHRADQQIVSKDLTRINGWSSAENNRRNKQSLRWLQQQVKHIREFPENRDRKIIVLTHHAPTIFGTADGQKPVGPDGIWSDWQNDILGGSGVNGLQNGDV